MEAKSFLHSFSTSAQQKTPRLSSQSPPARWNTSQKWISCKIHFGLRLVFHDTVFRKPFICKNSLGIDPVADKGNGFGNRPRAKNLAVFVSGGGSNFRSIHEAVAEGSIRGRISVLVTDKPGCGGAVYARDNGIPVILYPKNSSLPDGLSAVDLVTALRGYDIDFILLAGYLKLIPAELVHAYPRRIVNIHPSLLPAFGGKGYYGLKVHKAVIASGARYSGPTIHFVDEHYDTGRILAQRVVPVLASDTAEDLAARVLREEHQLYVQVTTALCEDQVVWREDGVPLIRSKENTSDYS